MLAAAPGAVHALWDPTRGGVAASLDELAAEAGVGVQLVERDIPLSEAVSAGCSLLGLDPLYVANDGRLVAMVDPASADELLAVMQARPDGQGECRIGTVVAEHPDVLVVRTGIGGTRIVDLPLGEQLPRIC
jgi:hydrogenase expression/formation protein HypE